MPPTSDPTINNLPGLVFLILIIAAPLAFLVSIGLLRLYRRAIIQAMRTRANSGQTESVPLETSALPQEPVQTSLNIAVLDSASVMPTRLATKGLYADLLHAPWRAAAIYAVAGFCYAVVMTIAYLASTGKEFLLFRFLPLLWIYAWPVVIVINIVAAATRRTKLMIASAYIVILATLIAIAVVTNAGLNWGQIALLWIITNLLVTGLLLNRSFRAVGPLVLIVMLLAVTGSAILPIIVGNNIRLLRVIINFGAALGLGDHIFTGLVVLGFIIFGVVGWLILPWIVTWYKQKKISDQSIIIDSIWLLFGVVQSIIFIFGGGVWFLGGLLAFVFYKATTWAGFSFVGYKPATSGKSPNLLLLRVFSLGKRSERLFDALAIHWRYVGSIRLIAGPDLATSTIEPHEFLDFLSGKLARRFIDNAQTLDLRISEMDVQPDHDGRFRVNDFFCYDDTWRIVLSWLVDESNVVLMDLRGFSSQNAGCIFEINELINIVPLEQVVFISDDTTDELFLRQVMQQSWDHMRSTSPNRLSTSGALHLFHLKGLSDGELQQFLHVLAIAANATPESQALA